jgi:hypothetical protein
MREIPKFQLRRSKRLGNMSKKTYVEWSSEDNVKVMEVFTTLQQWFPIEHPHCGGARQDTGPWSHSPGHDKVLSKG